FDMLFRPSVQPYLISWFQYDPAAEIAKVTVPTLIVQGTTDFQVGVDDARRLQTEDPRAKLTLIQGMNHILRDAPANRAANLATYSKPSLPLSTEVVRVITDFITHPY
ncbi:MAG: alpha/beta hydrolase, partial [Candidatus Eremiobacteraeota bacterium]|nr:alpha/beta hydrolase [Candidatus Eremiobacteraeota bacterium]